MSLPPKRPRGAPLGNLNALKHGFYTRRLKKHDLSGVDDTDDKNLIDEIAIVRVFTRRLVEALDPEADAYELAGTLRILCVALTSITRAMKTQAGLAQNGGRGHEEIDAAISQVWQEMRGRHPELPDLLSTSDEDSSPPTSSPS